MVKIVIAKQLAGKKIITNDIMMLMAVFSGKIYGRRSAKRRKEKKENEKTTANIENLR